MPDDFEPYDPDPENPDELAGLTTAQKKQRIRQRKFVDAYVNHGWNIASACSVTGRTRRTFYMWRKESEWFREQMQYALEAKIDMAEEQLFRQVEKGSTAAAVFYLKCHGKQRGYVEKEETTDREIVVKWPESLPSNTPPTLDSSESTTPPSDSRPSDAGDAGARPTD
jgi:hypothetical protein